MNDIIKSENHAMVAMEFNEQQVELIKRTVAKGTTNDELSLFLYTCKKTGLDPLIRQIYAVKRGGVMGIQTGIDGYRLIAERTGRYAPGREPSFREENGKLVSATAYVNKLVAGSWHEVAATARLSEYIVPTNHIWVKMPYAMLSKCAESLALRKAFPAEMGGVYTKEEMEQADVEVKAQPHIAKSAPLPTEKPVEAEIVKEEIDLAAKAEEAKKRKAEQEAQEAAKKPAGEVKSEPTPNETKAEPTSAQRVIKGLIEGAYPRKGRGPYSWKVNGEYIKSFDDTIAQTINDYHAANKPIECICEISQSGQYTNLMVFEIVKREENNGIMEDVAF